MPTANQMLQQSAFPKVALSATQQQRQMAKATRHAHHYGMSLTQFAQAVQQTMNPVLNPQLHADLNKLAETVLRKRRHIERRKNLRAADGALVGYRCWRMECMPDPNAHGKRDYFLLSPQQHTVWHGPVLEAEDWCNSDAVEGRKGVHASYTRHRLDPGNHNTHLVYGRVRGYGDFVRGERGFRAERMMIDKLWIPSILQLADASYLIHELLEKWGVDLIARLETRYECRVILYHHKTNPMNLHIPRNV